MKENSRPRSLSRDSHCRRATRCPEKDVASRIDITVVNRTAVVATPFSHSERAHAFGAVCGYRSASRARPGTISLVDFLVFNSVPKGLIAEHSSEGRPTSIQHRLRHSGFGESRSRDIPDDNALVGAHQPGRNFVEVIAPGVGDLGVDGNDPAPVAGALGSRQLRGIPCSMPQVRDDLAVAADSQGLKTEVDADLAIAMRCDNFRFNSEIEVPAAPRITGEGGRLDLGVGREITSPPKRIGTVPESHRVISKANSLVGMTDWNPIQVFLGRAPSGMSAGTVACDGELSANSAYRVGVQPEFLRTSARQGREIEVRWPLACLTTHSRLPPSFGFTLNRRAIIPDEIYGPRLCSEPSSEGCVPVSNSIAVRQNHRSESMHCGGSFQ